MRYLNTELSWDNIILVEKRLFAEIYFISDISLVSYNIWLTLYVSKQLFKLSPRNLIECPRILFWQNTMEPSMTHPATRCIILVLYLQNKFGWVRDNAINLCLHINWCRWLSSQSAVAHVAKTPSFHIIYISKCLSFIH